jgi:hypothetical protein
MVINLINITSKQPMAKEGIGTVQMALVGEPYYNETIFSFGDPRLPIKMDYTYDLGQSYSSAWNTYFTKTFNKPPISSSTTTTKYELPINKTHPKSGKLVIKKFEVEIKSI